MPPLILHNVPDEELYVGEDGVQRPYAMLFPGNDGNPTISRVRKPVPETGSFGKSTRRSRSRTGTPAASRREDPTLAAADAIFSAFVQNSAAESESPQRNNSLSASKSQPANSQSGSLAQIDGNVGGSSSRRIHKEPTEVLLRGFKSLQQYAAIREYERIGGRICEDYPRDPPLEQRRYKADLRDPASLRRKPMTAEEKTKALRFAGGDNWIKVTFESAEAAEAAIESSPQTIHGHIVHAEIYRGVPPREDEAIPANSFTAISGFRERPSRRGTSTAPRSFTQPEMSELRRGPSSISPEGSRHSTQTLESNTLSQAGTVSSATVTAAPTQQELLYCSKIPTAKRMQLLPAEQALLPQQSYGQRIMGSIPLISWLSSDIIGNTVPRTEAGEFDWDKASLYWKIVWWVDCWTGWFEVVGGEKDD